MREESSINHTSSRNALLLLIVDSKTPQDYTRYTRYRSKQTRSPYIPSRVKYQVPCMYYRFSRNLRLYEPGTRYPVRTTRYLLHIHTWYLVPLRTDCQVPVPDTQKQSHYNSKYFVPKKTVVVAAVLRVNESGQRGMHA